MLTPSSPRAQSKRGDEGLDISSLLIKHGASVNESNGESLNTATSLHAVQLVQAMLRGRKAIPQTLSRAFESALELPDHVRLVMMQMIIDAGLQKGKLIDAGLLKIVQNGSKDTETMGALLKFGASVHYHNHEALNAAARLCNHSVLRLLLQHITDPSAPSIVFGNRLRVGGWETLEMVHTLEILLDHGAQER